ncbi:MAG: hypothetical protein M1822_004462 [Bathelium mastoideum]|nr:MAG: hypothetical protein M1822_004462 [Bathelium mastoideum]
MFSSSFDTLDSDEWPESLHLLKGATNFIGQMTPIPWVHQICNTWFAYFGQFNGMKKWGAMQIEKRMERGSDGQDWASHTIKEALKQGNSPDELRRLKGDTMGLIAAGTNPAAGSLTCAFYRLSMHPEVADKVYREVRTVNHTDRQALNNCQYLNAFLMELLRLHPVVLTGGLRDSPPQGMTIGEEHIPGNVTLQVPRFSVARSEACFVRPNDFIPERWTTDTHLVLDERGHLPFGQSRHQCLGRRIAYVEMRMVIAMLLQEFEVRPAPDQDPTLLERETHDEFAANPGPFDAVFSRRIIL